MAGERALFFRTVWFGKILQESAGPWIFRIFCTQKHCTAEIRSVVCVSCITQSLCYCWISKFCNSILRIWHRIFPALVVLMSLSGLGQFHVYINWNFPWFSHDCNVESGECKRPFIPGKLGKFHTQNIPFSWTKRTTLPFGPILDKLCNVCVSIIP